MDSKTHILLADLPTELHTERMVVRAYKNGDGQALHDAVRASLAHLSAWMPWVRPEQTLDEYETYARNMQAKWIARDDFVFQLRRKSDDRFLGAMGVHDLKWEVGSSMMGWWVTADASGQGYASGGAAAVLAFAHKSLLLTRVGASCDEANAPSERVMQKIGMQREGLLRSDSRTPQGALCNTLLYASVPTR